MMDLFFSPHEICKSSSAQNGGFLSNLINKFQSSDETQTASNIENIFVDDFESQIMRIVPMPDQTSNHDFCGFVVSRRNEGRSTFVRMSKICRQTESSSTAEKLPVIKVHFVQNIGPGKIKSSVPF
jgi:hypothetical protein